MVIQAMNVDVFVFFDGNIGYMFGCFYCCGIFCQLYVCRRDIVQYGRCFFFDGYQSCFCCVDGFVGDDDFLQLFGVIFQVDFIEGVDFIGYYFNIRNGQGLKIDVGNLYGISFRCNRDGKLFIKVGNGIMVGIFN